VFIATWALNNLLNVLIFYSGQYREKVLFCQREPATGLRPGGPLGCRQAVDV